MLKLPIAKPELYRYSPHAGFMLFVDRVTGYSFAPARIETSVDIVREAAFFDRETDRMPSYVAFEYMAQSIALLAGIASVSRGEKPAMGFIMGLREFTFGAGFAPGTTVEIVVTEVFRDRSVAVFDGTADAAGKQIVKGTISTIAATDELLSKMREERRGA